MSRADSGWGGKVKGRAWERGEKGEEEGEQVEGMDSELTDNTPDGADPVQFVVNRDARGDRDILHAEVSNAAIVSTEHRVMCRGDARRQ